MCRIGRVSLGGRKYKAPYGVANIIPTEISTMLVRERTRTMSKKVNRFLLVGRVVRKKLRRARQQRFETTMESRQRTNFTASAIFSKLFDQILVFSLDFLLFFYQKLNLIIRLLSVAL